MPNAVTEAFEAVQKSIADMRKDNDQSYEELKKGHETRFRELQEKCDKQEAQIVQLIKARNDLERQKVLIDERVDLLEAMADRPKGSIISKMVDEDCELFLRWFRSGGRDNEAKSARDNLRTKALELKVGEVAIGTALLGGNALPKIIESMVGSLIRKLSGVVDAIGPQQVGSSDYNKLLTISGAAGNWAAELGARSQTAAANLRNIKPTWGELYSYTFASKESMEDIFFDVQGWLVNDIAMQHALALSTAIYSGNGSARPTGMTNTTPTATADYASPMRAAAVYQFVSHSGVDTSSPNRLTLDILLAAIYALAPGYRSGSQFAMNSVTQGIARRLKTTFGEYLWQPSVQAGQPDRLFGYPVFTWEDLADGNTVDGFVAAFGNWPMAYSLVNRGELAIVAEGITTPGTTKFYVSRRWGGIPYNNDAVKFVRNAD